jgi:hypothetical protein
MAKAARKRSAGLAVITQDAADVLGTQLGQAVIANSATQILMRQAPQAIDQVADAFGLTDTERHLLLSARRGEALLAAGSHRVRFEVVASADEHSLTTTDPGFDKFRSLRRLQLTALGRKPRQLVLQFAGLEHQQRPRARTGQPPLQ